MGGAVFHPAKPERPHAVLICRADISDIGARQRDKPTWGQNFSSLRHSIAMASLLSGWF